jgi:hypothetical protein
MKHSESLASLNKNKPLEPFTKFVNKRYKILKVEENLSHPLTRSKSVEMS